jgi:hypothetical protein
MAQDWQYQKQTFKQRLAGVVGDIIAAGSIIPKMILVTPIILTDFLAEKVTGTSTLSPFAKKSVGWVTKEPSLVDQLRDYAGSRISTPDELFLNGWDMDARIKDAERMNKKFLFNYVCLNHKLYSKYTEFIDAIDAVDPIDAAEQKNIVLKEKDATADTLIKHYLQMISPKEGIDELTLYKFFRPHLQKNFNYFSTGDALKDMDLKSETLDIALTASKAAQMTDVTATAAETNQVLTDDGKTAKRLARDAYINYEIAKFTHN